MRYKGEYNMKNRNRYISKASAVCFILPAILVVGLLLLYPVASSVFYSFTSKNLIKATYKFVGLKNYIKVLSDPLFLSSFVNSLKWTVLSLIGQVLVGFTAALALNHIKKGRGIYRTILIIPWAFPSIVIALSWKWILNGVYGFIPHLLVKLGIVNELPQLLTSKGLVFGTLVFINIWFGAPLIMVNVLSALQTVPKDQYEAAHIDGASRLQSFYHITVPHISVVVGLLVVLRTIWVFNNFDTIFLITGGGPANLTQTVPIYAYNVGWGQKQLGVSSAVTVLLMIFLLLICAVYFRILNKMEKESPQ
jgi:multiple sugar transport system permease protein